MSKYNNELYKYCISFDNRKNKKISKEEVVINDFVNHWYLDEQIEYFNDVESRIIKMISNSTDPKSIANYFESNHFIKTYDKIIRAKFYRAYRKYLNDLIFIERDYLYTKTYKKITR